MNITFGGMESWMDNTLLRRRTLDKYFRTVEPATVLRPVRTKEHQIEDADEPRAIQEARARRNEKERMILGAWLLGSLAVVATFMTIAL